MDYLEQEQMNDTFRSIGEALRAVANAITPVGAMAGTDATGGYVRSLTEASIGTTAALVQIAGAIETHSASVDLVAEALDRIAQAIADHGETTSAKNSLHR